MELDFVKMSRAIIAHELPVRFCTEDLHNCVARRDKTDFFMQLWGGRKTAIKVLAEVLTSSNKLKDGIGKQTPYVDQNRQLNKTKYNQVVVVIAHSDILGIDVYVKFGFDRKKDEMRLIVDIHENDPLNLQDHTWFVEQLKKKQLNIIK